MTLPDNTITDSRKNKEKAFESIKHDHSTNNPNRLQTLECRRCKFLEGK